MNFPKCAPPSGEEFFCIGYGDLFHDHGAGFDFQTNSNNELPLGTGILYGFASTVDTISAGNGYNRFPKELVLLKR